MQDRGIKSFAILLGIIVPVILVLVAVAAFTSSSTSPTDTSALTNDSSIRLQSLLGEETTLSPGAKFEVGVLLDVGSSSSPISVASLVLSYDPAVLSGTSISEGGNILALGKNINNVEGKMAVDVALQGQGSFDPGAVVATFEFTAVSTFTQGTTTISVDPTSQLGAVNIVPSQGLGTLIVALEHTFCGDGEVQSPNSQGVNEVCDPGVTSGQSSCALSCLVQCLATEVFMDGACVSVTQEPFGGIPRVIPGRIQAEDFDQGPHGVAYMDSDPLTNNGGAYRTTGVDLKAELDGSIVVGWMPAGEWLEYTVNVPVAGSFVWQFRMNALEVGRKLDIYVDDQLQFSVNVPVTAAWGELATTAVFDKPLAAGEHIIRVQNAGGDFLDFDFFTIGTLPAGCRGDYDYSGTLDILDLAPFAQNYRMEGVSCDLDIVETEQACYLDIADLAEFARPYLSEQACALP